MFGGSSDPYVSVWDQGNAGTKKKDEIWRAGHIDSPSSRSGAHPRQRRDLQLPIEELRPKTAGADEEYHDRSKYKTYRLDVMDYNKMTKEVFLGAVYLSPEHYHCEEGKERQEDYEWSLTMTCAPRREQARQGQASLQHPLCIQVNLEIAV